MIFLSIVVPSFNAQKTILPLLVSIVHSKGIGEVKIECIIADDCSKDDTVLRAQQFITTNRQKNIRFKIIRLKTNSGPARARNIGVKYAKGRIVLFLDSDVVLYKKTLSELVRCFQNDPDLFAITGVWDKHQKSNKFFPKFKALRDWSYWINERDPRNYYYLFSTRIAAIDRKLFLRLGGFNETYKAALVEDIELTYRIAKRYAVVFNPMLKVSHEFEDFVPVAKKYFWRAYFWSRMYRERKKFDPVATTSKEAITTISAAFLVMFLVLTCLGFLVKSADLTKIFLVVTTVFFGVHLWGVRKFLWFCVKEEGIVFALKAFAIGIVLYMIILFGSFSSFIGLIREDSGIGPKQGKDSCL